MRSLIPVVCAVGLLCGLAPAQEIQQQRQGGQMRHAKTMAFISQEMGAGEVGATVVKGVPFSAETVTEFRQTLGDGNIIERKTQGAIYRDSEGRTRREQPLSAGAGALGAVPEQIVIIRDPVAGLQWTLDPSTKTATKMATGGQIRHSTGAMWVGETLGPVQLGSARLRHVSGSGPKEEDLGTQLVNGVQATGTRVTMSIPAGSIGNARDIEIVTERWDSPQIQMNVRTHRTDPRTGNYSFELTNISLSEPSPALFQVPPDYAIREGGIIGDFSRGVPGGVAHGVSGGVGVQQVRRPRQQLRHSEVPPQNE